MKINKKLLIPAAALVAVAALSPVANAALTATSTLNQTINAGTISTDIRDGSNAVVVDPVFPMSAMQISTGQQTSTGTFGTATQRISVDNPGGADNGFSLTLNASDPTNGMWSSGANTYDYKGTAATGQLTVDPSVSTWTALTGTTTSITKGTSAAFTGATSTAITLATTGATLENIWNGYVTGIGLSQTIPANTPAGTYTISMTQTVAAL